MPPDAPVTIAVPALCTLFSSSFNSTLVLPGLPARKQTIRRSLLSVSRHASPCRCVRAAAALSLPFHHHNCSHPARPCGRGILRMIHLLWSARSLPAISGSQASRIGSDTPRHEQMLAAGRPDTPKFTALLTVKSHQSSSTVGNAYFSASRDTRPSVRRVNIRRQADSPFTLPSLHSATI
jgi:hypothetical protein